MAQAKHTSYRQLSEELDAIVAQLQQGNVDIEDAVKRYERGLQLIAQMQKHLQTAETKITELKSQFGADEDTEA